MFTGVTDEGLKMLRNFAVKVRKLKILALDFLLVELRNKAAHGFEIYGRLVNDALYQSVAFWIEVFRARQAKRGPDVSAGRVIPESDISQRDFVPQNSLVSGLVRRQELERDLREAAQSDGKKLCGLSGLIPWSRDEAGAWHKRAGLDTKRSIRCVCFLGSRSPLLGEPPRSS